MAVEIFAEVAFLVVCVPVTPWTCGGG